MISVSAAAQTGPQPSGIPEPLQTRDEALGQDAAAVADILGVSADEALRQLYLQEASVAVTDDIARRFAERFVGVSIDHNPGFRISVLLTGDAPVPDEQVDLAGSLVAVTFRVGAKASHA
ncbi:MAG: hypothetical protein EON55_14465, partial [Alphaproteobacteria bacterium]